VDVDVVQPTAARRSRWTRWRPVLIWWLLALLAFAAERLLAPRMSERTLLVGPVSREGFQFLALAATVLLTAGAVWTTVSVSTRPPAPAWTRVLSTVVHLAVAVALLLCLYPALLLGALSFSNEYRTIGEIHGEDIVVERGVGLGQFPLRAGVRHGLFVDFDHTTGDSWTTAGGPLDEMRFDVVEGPDVVTITFDHGPGDRTGTMEVLLVP
jgi:hypothetical protein